MPVTYEIDVAAILEIVEEDTSLTEAQQTAAAEAILEELSGGAACLNSLARFLVEQSGVDTSDFAEEED